jgi:hypothetical protein
MEFVVEFNGAAVDSSEIYGSFRVVIVYLYHTMYTNLKKKRAI